jgi:hypothetical protein
MTTQEATPAFQPCTNAETCEYFLFDEDHPSYGELCGRPATREFIAFGSSFHACNEHFEDAAEGASQLIASLDGCDTTFVN